MRTVLKVEHVCCAFGKDSGTLTGAYVARLVDGTSIMGHGDVKQDGDFVTIVTPVLEITGKFAGVYDGCVGNPWLKWEAGGWALHNLVGHPLSEIAQWFHLRALSNWLHDVTVPWHVAGTGRG